MAEVIGYLPSILYHYTSISNLALILNSRKIRFSSLDRVDDLLEGQTADMGMLGQYVFVSCWTDLAEESIPFWNMYTPNMTGVRIALPSCPFTKYPWIGDPARGVEFGPGTTGWIPEQEIHGDGYLVFSMSGPERVEYTDNTTQIAPQVFRENGDVTSVGFGRLGRYKRSEWRFQSEWRYRILASPVPPPPITSYNDPSYMDNFIAASKQWLINHRSLPFDNFLIQVSDEAFAQMQVVLGPKHTAGDRAIVEALLNTYNPNAQLADSMLCGKIK
jgi:hypothetical protein